jgi:nicotinamidase/pyrazinamidase
MIRKLQEPDLTAARPNKLNDWKATDSAGGVKRFPMVIRNKGVVLWDVDTQFDFLLPGGRLYVPGAERILPNLRLLASMAAEQAVPVISSTCAHLPGDPELKIYGEHCMLGTPGQQKVPETLLPHRFTVPNRPILLPRLDLFQQIILEKQAFDVFSNPNTEEVVHRLGEGLRVVLYGVTTEICVARAANSLLDRGHQVQLVKEATAALDLRRARAVLRSFVDRGGRLVSVNDIATHARAA